MFEIDCEKYSNVKIALGGLLSDLKSIEEIVLNRKIYKIKKMLGGDMKSLALLLGGNS